MQESISPDLRRLRQLYPHEKEALSRKKIEVYHEYWTAMGHSIYLLSDESAAFGVLRALTSSFLPGIQICQSLRFSRPDERVAWETECKTHPILPTLSDDRPDWSEEADIIHFASPSFCAPLSFWTQRDIDAYVADHFQLSLF